MEAMVLLRKLMKEEDGQVLGRKGRRDGEKKGNGGLKMLQVGFAETENEKGGELGLSRK